MKKMGLLLLGVLLTVFLAACGKTQESETIPTKQATPSAETHGHTAAAQPQISKDPEMLYCGNTFTTVRVGDKQYGFDGEKSVALTDLLLHLQYENPVCDCLPVYTVDTEFGTGYGISLDGCYVRYDGRQVSLTQEQTEKITEMITWALKNVESIAIEKEGAEK